MRRRVDLFGALNGSLLLLWGLVVAYPFYNAVIVSLVSESDYVRSPFMLFPKRVILDSYLYLLRNRGLLNGYRSTLIILALGVPLNMALTVSSAYVLSRAPFPGKRAIFFLIVTTMFFSGGLIPTYLVVQRLGLTNTYWSVVLLLGLNAFYMIVTKTYFQGIPDSLEESARIDGANDIVILTRIFLPLSKPVLATFLLFYAVDRWNEWFFSMLFIQKSTMIPLQVILRNMVFVTIYEIRDSALDSVNTFFGEGIKMAAIVLTMLPIMFFYPFLQKHFVKGVLVGAIKS